MAFDWNQSPNVTTQAASSAGSGLVGAGAGLAETFIQQKINAHEAEKAFQRQRKLMREEYDYNQMAQRNAATNMRKSLEDAGISPVAMSGASFTPAGTSASGVSSASVNAPRLRPDPVMAQAAVNAMQVKDLQASADLKDAQKDNVNAQTTGVRIDNNRKADADSSVTENMRVHWNAVRDKLAALGKDTGPIDDIISQIDAGERSYTLGALEANRLFEEYRSKNLDNVPKLDEAFFASKVAGLKANNDKIAQALASMPLSEQNKVEAEIQKLYSDVYRAQVAGALDASKISEINTRIKQITQDMKSAYLRDPRLMLADEDYAHFASYLGMDVYERGMNVLEGLIGQKASQMGAEALQDIKQEGAEALETMRQEGNDYRSEMRNAPKTERSNGYKNEDGSYSQTKTTTFANNPHKPDYTQPRKKSRRRGKK